MTLVELLMGIVVSAIILLGAYAALTYFFSTVRKAEEKRDLQRDASDAATWIQRAVTEASWVYLDQDNDGSIVARSFAGGWEKRIYADNGRLMVEEDGDTSEAIGTLDSIHFRAYVGRLEYDFQVAQDGDTVEIENARTALRNVQYRGLWHFAGGSGNVTYDDSPYNNNAAIYGASWTTGSLGNALSFDGANNYLMVPDNDYLDSSKLVGYSAQVEGSGFGEARTILNRNTQSAVHGFFWVYVQNNQINYSFSTGSVTSVSSSTLSWESGRWYDVYVQHDGDANRVHFYRDGEKVGSSTYSGTMIPVTEGDAYIGAYQGTGSFWQGTLDEVKFTSF